MKSLVLTIPAALRDTANRVARAVGHDDAPDPGATFVVGFSADGSLPATHYSARTQAADSFLSLLGAAAGGQVPDEAPAGGSWEDYAITSADAIEVSQALLFHVLTDEELTGLGWSYGDHFREANAGWGLMPAEPAEE